MTALCRGAPVADHGDDRDGDDADAEHPFGINDGWEIHVCNRLSGQGGDGRLRGTDGSNPPPSSKESVRTRLRGAAGPGADDLQLFT